jgi:hypothetical protein
MHTCIHAYIQHIDGENSGFLDIYTFKHTSVHVYAYTSVETRGHKLSEVWRFSHRWEAAKIERKRARVRITYICIVYVRMIYIYMHYVYIWCIYVLCIMYGKYALYICIVWICVRLYEHLVLVVNWNFCMSLHAWDCAFMLFNVTECMCMCKCTCVCICMYEYMYVCMCIYSILYCNRSRQDAHATWQWQQARITYYITCCC